MTYSSTPDLLVLHAVRVTGMADDAAVARRTGIDISGVLARFGGYDERFSAALARVQAGEKQWVASVGVPSCHAVWMELHEDLLSTLGIPRGA